MRGRRLADSDSPDYTATRSEDPVQSPSPFRPNITSLVGLANAPESKCGITKSALGVLRLRPRPASDSEGYATYT